MRIARRWIGVSLLLLGVLAFAPICHGAEGWVEIPDLGFSMKLPPGWKTYPAYKNMFYQEGKRKDNQGWVTEYLLQGKSLSEFVDASLKDLHRMKSLQRKVERLLGEAGPGQQSLKEEPPKVVSRTMRQINGLEAIEVLCEGEYAVLELYVRKGPKVISVLLRTLKEDFPKYEPSFRQAIDSITIR